MTVTCHINSGMEFSTYGMMSVLKRSFGVWSILDFWIRYIQLVLETTTSMGMLALQPPIVSHPMASTIPTVTASTAMAPGDLSPSGRCPSAPGIHGTGNEQSSHWNCWGSTMGSLTPLCTCTCSKNFHYKESLQKKKKGSSRTLRYKNSREKHSVKNRTIHERYFRFIWRK